MHEYGEENGIRQGELSLPEDMNRAVLDEQALGLTPHHVALGWNALPWRLSNGVLQVLVPDSLDLDRWLPIRAEILDRLIYPGRASSIEFHSSGLSDEKLYDVIDFHYRRLDSDISCVNMFEFICPMKWENLREVNLTSLASESSFERFCDSCERSVYLVANEREFQNRAEAGDCVAYIPPAPPAPFPLSIPQMPMLAGAPMPPEPPFGPPPLPPTSDAPTPPDDTGLIARVSKSLKNLFED